MSDKQKIPQFWDKGPMLTTGCTKVSPGCKNCWSERAHVMRSKNPAVQHIYNPDLLTNGKFNGKVQFNLRLLEAAAKARKPQKIAIWNDLYHPGVTDEQIIKFFHAICENNRKRERKAPLHTILIVTKRPERGADIAKRLWRTAFGETILLDPTNTNAIKMAGSTMSKFWPNIWHITTTENQHQADERIPHLLRIPGKRGIIIEPMLEEMSFRWMMQNPRPQPTRDIEILKHIHQVILGPENGPGKRPFMNWWADGVKAQCMDSGVPFYRKDTGEGILAWRR